MKDASKQDTLVIKNQIADGLDLLYVNLDKQNSETFKEKAFVELPNTFPTYVSTGNLIMENTLVVPQVLYWLNMSTNTILDGFKFINNYASSEEWRDLPEDEKIARQFHILLASFRTRRYRIKKKMRIEDEYHLTKFIRRLYV